MEELRALQKQKRRPSLFPRSVSGLGAAPYDASNLNPFLTGSALGQGALVAFSFLSELSYHSVQILQTRRGGRFKGVLDVSNGEKVAETVPASTPHVIAVG